MKADIKSLLNDNSVTTFCFIGSKMHVRIYVLNNR